MKKLGMQVEQIEDVQSIVIRTPKGNWVFDSAEVTAMTMQGATTYQVTGTPRFEEAAPDIPKEDVTMVAAQANVPEEKARSRTCCNERRHRRSDPAACTVMIEAGDRVLLVGAGREFFVRAGQGTLGTDRGQLDLAMLVGKSAGDRIATHSGAEFTVRIPRPTDFFTYGKRSGAPMLPKDIGLVIAYTGMNHNDDVLDAGTGSGIAAIYFGGVARSVKTYEVRPEFSTLAMKNIAEAKLTNVEAVAADFLAAEGTFDVVHLDMQVQPEHIAHAYSLLRPGGTSRATRRSSNRWRSWSMQLPDSLARCTPTS